MAGSHLKDLSAFLMVAEEASFTRAAIRLGITQSSLSQIIRGLETRLGLRLFARTTRSVALTEAGERLLGLIGPAMNELEAGLARIGELRDKPAGTLRLTADEYAVHAVLMPAIARLVPDYPDIRVEITTDYGLTDIVSGRFDAGVRRGGLVAKDMIAVPISLPIPMVVVASPAYFARHPAPQQPQQLVEHQCVNLRLPTHGEIYAWTFTRAGRDHRVKSEGQVVVSSISAMRDAALQGVGLTYLPLHYVQDRLASGELVEALTEWRKTYEGYHLYYPNRRLASPVFTLLLQALRDNLEDSRKRTATSATRAATQRAPARPRRRAT
ncbi:MAG TPA: LysR family transcriptional regulator [Stenotrophomonas sp.]|nr:LysR family transcriptional regulator [Stenotrophomonas sp.]